VDRVTHLGHDELTTDLIARPCAANRSALQPHCRPTEAKRLLEPKRNGQRERAFELQLSKGTAIPPGGARPPSKAEPEARLRNEVRSRDCRHAMAV
jgi:hypothetical protein